MVKIKACSKLVEYSHDADSEWQQLKYEIKQIISIPLKYLNNFLNIDYT